MFLNFVLEVEELHERLWSRFFEFLEVLFDACWEWEVLKGFVSGEFLVFNIVIGEWEGLVVIVLELYLVFVGVIVHIHWFDL